MIAVEGQVFLRPGSGRPRSSPGCARTLDGLGRRVHEAEGRHQRPVVSRWAMADPPARADPMTQRPRHLQRLQAQVDAGKPIIGAGAGTGLSAKLAEAGAAPT